MVQAKSDEDELRSANLSLEGALADLKERKACLKGELKAEREERARIVDEVSRCHGFVLLSRDV